MNNIDISLIVVVRLSEAILSVRSAVSGNWEEAFCAWDEKWWNNWISDLSKGSK